MPPSPLSLLKEKLQALGQLQGTLALLDWDQAVFMPSQADEARAQMIGGLSTRAHQELLQLNENNLLKKLRATAPKGDTRVIIEESFRSYEHAARLPASFVKELALATSRAQVIWAKARKENNFRAFAPTLEKMVALKKKEAVLVAPHLHPYDALLETYEPGLRIATLDPLFSELAAKLVTLLKQIQAKKRKPLDLKGTFPLAQQEAFNKCLATALGFDFSCGRLDASTHPFTTNFHPTDVRLTTRYREEDALYAIGSTIHEVGHGLYEQGLPTTQAYTPLAEAISLGIHESQSRLWENIVGKDLAFWEWFQPQLAKAFPKPYAKHSPEALWQHVNRISPSLIRTEADEITYNLHILLRYRLERALLEGTLSVRKLPQAWNDGMQELLGIDVPTDARGVLQDVHWSAGLFGYFPTYTLGNLYGSQFFAQAKQDSPRLQTTFRNGNFQPLLTWLREHIHRHGKRYSAEALVKRVTGAPLSSQPFITYLTAKMTDVYDL